MKKTLLFIFVVSILSMFIKFENTQGSSTSYIALSQDAFTASDLVVSEVVGGTTYYTVDGLKVAGNTRAFRQSMIANTGGIILTNSTSQTSSVFIEDQMSRLNVENKGFSTYFQMEVQRVGFSHADGFVFIMARDSNALGSTGGGLGYQGILNSIGIEFDFFDNGGVEGPVPNSGFQQNGILLNNRGTYLIQSGMASFGDYYNFHIWIDLDDQGINGNTLSVRVNDDPGRPVNPLYTKTNIDLSSISDNYYAGLTASTGFAASRFILKQWFFANEYLSSGIVPSQQTFSQDLTPPTSPELTFSNNQISIGGSTDADSGVSAYQYREQGTTTWQTYSQPIDINTSKVIESRAIDSVGNTSQISSKSIYKRIIYEGSSTSESYQETAFTLSDLTPETRTGYQFDGFYKDQNFTQIWTQNDVTSLGVQDLELYAKWTINQYTITFDSNQGTDVTSITQDYNTEVTAPSEPLRIGYSFSGWFSDVALENAYIFTTLTAEDITLYAKWTINQYTITFNSNEGTDVSSIAQDYNTEVTEPSDPIRTGYTFSGWFSDVALENAYTFSTISAINITLYAKWTINQYTITFDSNQGTDVASITQDYNTEVTAPSDPIRTGYTFSGWFSDVALENAYTFSTISANNITLYAKWTINQYTITFDTDGGTTINAITQDYDTEVTAPSESLRTGYTFSGWFSDAALENAYTFSTISAINITLYAKWTINQYTITFDSNQGTDVASITQDYNTEVTAPNDPTRIGYTFSGWFSDVRLENAYTFTTLPAENITLYAKWTINQYTITFDTDGGTTINAITQDYDTEVTGPSNPTKEGYTFNGWSLEIPSRIPSEDMTITALWTINQYTITFDTDGGTEVSPITQDYQTEVSIPTNPTKTGYSFTGWNEDIPSSMPGDDLTLIAQWSINTYTITFNSNEGSDLTSITQDYNTNVTAPSEPTRTGYSFSGWFSDTALENAYTFSTISANNITLYAKWTINQHTITFDTDGGTTINSITQDYNSEVTAPIDPTRTGYTFNGWDVSIPSTIPSEDITLTATWTINQYTITFDSNEGSTVDIITQDYNTNVTASSEPTRTGYSFSGWFSDTALENAYTFSTISANNITLYAKWTINQYTITFDSNQGTDVGSITQDYNTEVTAPSDPIRTGYTFSGWFSDTALENAYTFSTITANNITLYANWEANIYDITFDSNTGSGSMTALSISFDSSASLTQNTFDKIGYSFSGWNTSVDGDGTTYHDEANFTMNVEGLILYAQWTINQYTITFDTDGGTTINAITQDYDTEVTGPSNPTKEGYTFSGWDVSIPSTIPSEDITLTATWTINQYTITFDSNEGSDVASITQDYNTEVTAPSEPSRTGYTFSGWDVSIPTTIPSEDITLTATWTINQYTITFDTDGGTTINAITQDYDTEVTGPSNPTKEGYTFNGWSLEIPSRIPSEDMTITALWTINQYTITFDTDGGTEVSPITQDYQTEVSIPTNPTKTGYSFTGWNEDIPSSMPGDDLTLIAQWSINTYTITFNSNEGSDLTSITQDYNTNVTAPNDPTRIGYTFSGWFSDVRLENAYTFTTLPAENITLYAKWTINQYTITFDTDGGSELVPITSNYQSLIVLDETPEKEGHIFLGFTYEDQLINEIVMPAFDVEIKVVYEVIPDALFTMTFDTNGGNRIDNVELKFNDSLTPYIVTPTKVGYTFIGWFDYLNDERFENNQMPARHINLYARWSINSYRITYYFNNQMSNYSEQLVYEQRINYPLNPEKIGFDFVHWTRDYITNIPFNLDKMPAENIELYAYYVPHVQDVTVITEQGVLLGEIISNEAISIQLNMNLPEGYIFMGWYTLPFGKGIKISIDQPVLDAYDTMIYPYFVKTNNNEISMFSYGRPSIKEHGLNTEALVINGVILSMILVGVSLKIVRKKHED
jgi:uncharacterized repeat protein (TIGR02543 family)